MTNIPKEIQEFILQQRLGYVASVSEKTEPCISPRGSIIPWGNQHIIFADIKSPRTTNNIKHKSRVEICVIDPISRRGWRFAGLAKLVESKDEYSKMLKRYEMIGIRSKIKNIIIVDIDLIQEVLSPSYDLGMKQQDIKEEWRKYYLQD